MQLIKRCVKGFAAVEFSKRSAADKLNSALADDIAGGRVCGRVLRGKTADAKLFRCPTRAWPSPPPWRSPSPTYRGGGYIPDDETRYKKIPNIERLCPGFRIASYCSA